MKSILHQNPFRRAPALFFLALELVLANAQPAHDVKELKSVFYIKNRKHRVFAHRSKLMEGILIMFYGTKGTYIDWTLLDYC